MATTAARSKLVARLVVMVTALLKSKLLQRWSLQHLAQDYKNNKTLGQTRMHSSRMHTGRSFTICRSKKKCKKKQKEKNIWGGGCLVRGGVSALGGCLLWGCVCLLLGGWLVPGVCVCSWGCDLGEGVSLVWGMSALGSVCCGGGIRACTEADIPHGQNHRRL